MFRTMAIAIAQPFEICPSLVWISSVSKFQVLLDFKQLDFRFPLLHINVLPRRVNCTKCFIFSFRAQTELLATAAAVVPRPLKQVQNQRNDDNNDSTVFSLQISVRRPALVRCLWLNVIFIKLGIMVLKTKTSLSVTFSVLCVFPDFGASS